MKQRFSKRTRLVSALLTLAMVFTFLPFSAFAAGGTHAHSTIELSKQNFPDDAFRDYLKSMFDKNYDRKLAPAERNAVKQIVVWNMGIRNLKGIEFFPNLKYLNCTGNELTSLDVHENTALTYLDCSKNQLTSLDVRNNTALDELYCYQNQLTSLDVRQNTALKMLSCGKNKLTSLDVTKNKALKELDCAGNQLVELDTRDNAALEKLNCERNRLAGINLEDNLNLYLANISVGDNVYPAEMKSDRTVDLSKLPNRFDVERTSFWYGGTRQGNILTVKEGVTKVRYKYDYKGSLTEDFYLDVSGTVPPVTPPSGGGTTIPPEAGKYQLTVTDGVATVNGSTGAVLNVKPGDTVTLTADTTKFPENEEFGWWEITPYGSVSNTLTGQYQRTATFTMPNENVSARAMSKSAGVSTGGDDGGGGGGAAILLVGGAAVAGLVGYGVYSYVSEQQLKALLPEGVAMPENRAQTALLLWNTAGRPEPAEAPAFKDVADPDTAKAAQWCVEHGLMDQKLGGRFAPDNSDPAYKTLNAYQQLVG